MSYYAYMRVSTTKQDIARQEQAINDYKKAKNLTIPKENYYTDYYTGKTFDRENYRKLVEQLNKGDYLIVKEVDRLGRNWDLIKEEWTRLQDLGVKIIIIDLPILSDALPNETEMLTGLTGRLIKEQMLTLMCYSAQLERDKISQRTKEALAEKKLHGTKSGKPIGKPKSIRNTDKTFIDTLKLLCKGYSQRNACYETNFPVSTLKTYLRGLYNKFNTHNYNTILNEVERGNL
jgi:DNA invertase Pin-like site-specific DNA recombinase